MPELPEVQAHAERLDADLAGATLERFVALTFTALKTADPPPGAGDGHQVVFVGRRGKHILIDLGVVTFVVHLMQGGRLRFEQRPSARPRNGQARWTFADGRSLLLTEPGSERRAGVWVVAGDPEAQAPLDGLGPDADQVDRATLARLLSQRSGRLHGFLRDQHTIAGIGRRLANEICFRAELSPFANTGRLEDGEIDRLAEAIAATIAESLAFERGRTEMSSSADRPGAVHGREGEACVRCGDRIATVEYRNYTVSYCPHCQTGGKVLADNTTSRFLK